MGRRADISRGKQLLVEGNDQRNFFEAFMRYLGISDSVQIQNFGGVDDLRGFLSAFVRMPGFHFVESVGIVRDAEKSERSAFQSVQSSLTNAKLPTPTEPGIRSGGTPSVTVLVLPGGGRPGMLETVLRRTFDDLEVSRCIDDFFDCAKSLPGVSIGNPDKARAYVYLATTPNSHHSVGVAAKAGVWNLEHAVFDGVRNFLDTL